MSLVRWTGRLLMAATVLGSGPAFAADLPIYEPPAPVMIPEFHKPWQGFSLGLLGTYGFGEHERKLSNLDLDGPMFGGLAGIHGQVGSWVFGAEFDGSFGSISGSRGYKTQKDRNRSQVRKPKLGADGNPVMKDGQPVLELVADGKDASDGAETKEQRTARFKSDYDKGRFTYPAKTTVDEFYSFRGRIGYALDNVLLYGTGGLGVAHVKAKTEHPYWGEYSDQRYGVTPVAGGGVEYMFTENLSLRAEYLYAFPFTVAMKQKQTVWAAPNRTDASFDGSHLIRAGISYHLPVF